MEKILRINLTEKSFLWGQVPEGWKRLGGRALGDCILTEEVDPLCDPLGDRNKIVFAPGLLGGTQVSTSSRISIISKSPLTGGIKESNGGGITSLKLARLGIKALIVEGMATKDSPFVLKVSKAGVDFLPADGLTGKGIYSAAKILLRTHGKKVGAALIGPAGERSFRAASIANLDKDGSPTRFCGRGGLGAVMGAKGVKALVLDDDGGNPPPIAQSELFQSAIKRYLQVLKENPSTSQVYPKYGTSIIVQYCNEFGAMPTRNFSRGQFEKADGINGETMYQNIISRGGKGAATHACMPGCVVRCSNIYPGSNGRVIVGPLEYETICLLGSNCEVGDLDEIAYLNYLCNDLGVDTIETGATLGVAMEAGLIHFGDVRGMKKLMGEIKRGTVLGKVLANGVVTAGRVLGVKRVPAVKGQAMAGYDPRGTKTVGVTYSTSPMGADHTGGTGLHSKIDRLSPIGHVDNSRNLQIEYAGIDSLGICIMAGGAVGDKPDLIADLIRGRYGWDIQDDFFVNLGKEALRTERAFNNKAGFTQAQDRLPEFFLREELPPHRAVFDVPYEEIDTFYSF